MAAWAPFHGVAICHESDKEGRKVRTGLGQILPQKFSLLMKKDVCANGGGGPRAPVQSEENLRGDQCSCLSCHPIPWVSALGLLIPGWPSWGQVALRSPYSQSLTRRGSNGPLRLDTEDPAGNISHMAGHTLSATTAHLCRCRRNRAMDKAETNRRGCVPTKLHAQKQVVGQMCPQVIACQPLVW